MIATADDLFVVSDEIRGYLVRYNQAVRAGSSRLLPVWAMDVFCETLASGPPKRPSGKAARSAATEANVYGTSQGATTDNAARRLVQQPAYGSTVTSTYAGTPSAPFLSVTRSLKRKVRVSET